MIWLAVALVVLGACAAWVWCFWRGISEDWRGYEEAQN